MVRVARGQLSGGAFERGSGPDWGMSWKQSMRMTSTESEISIESMGACCHGERGGWMSYAEYRSRSAVSGLGSVPNFMRAAKMRGEKQSETSGISSAMHAFALVKPGESTTMLAIVPMMCRIGATNGSGCATREA